jgi:hypothetical protein
MLRSDDEGIDALATELEYACFSMIDPEDSIVVRGHNILRLVDALPSGQHSCETGERGCGAGLCRRKHV